MNVHFEVVHRSLNLQRLLRHDGWVIRQKVGDALSASHPEVLDQAAARYRLQHLGILTSPAVRIEFLREPGYRAQ